MRRGSRASEKPLPITLISRHNAQFQACAGTKPLCVKWLFLGAVDLAGFPARV